MMKKFFKFGKNKKESGAGATGKLGSTQSISGIGGYDVNEKEISKLHKAAWSGDLSKVKQLAKKDPSPIDKENRTPLHLACVKGHADIVDELIAWKAKLNHTDNNGQTPLMKAIECSQVTCAKTLLEAHAEVSTVDSKGNTCLHEAVRQGQYEVCSLLLDYNANPDIRNKEYIAPLHLATLEKHAEICKLLLEKDADIDITDENKRTPLMQACADGSIGLVKLYLQYDADVLLKDSKNWTADDCAVIAGHHACSQLITETLQPPNNSAKSTPRGSTPAQTPRSDNPDIDGEVAGAVGGVITGGFGAPAVDTGDLSEAENTISGISGPRSDRLDSWADSEEESLGFGLSSKKTAPKLSLAKFVKGSDEESQQESEMKASKIPRRKDSTDNTPKKVGFSENVETSPTAARSNIPQLTKRPSQSSVLSNSSWGNNSPDILPDTKKPSLVRYGNMSNLLQDDTDVESEDETDLPILDLSLNIKSKQPSDSKILNSDSTSAAAKEKQVSEEEKAKRKAVLEELGLSDVEDVSDPETSEVSPRKGGSDWDTTQADGESLPYTPRGPKMIDDDWDSTNDDTTPRTPRGHVSVKPKIGEALVEEPTKSSGSDWDSTPRRVSNEPKIPQDKRESIVSDWDSVTEDIQTTQKAHPLLHKKDTINDEDSPWDEEDGVATTPSKTDHPTVVTTAGPADDTETESEQVSEWELERKRKKELDERQHQWELEQAAKREALKKEAAEELEKEKEEKILNGNNGEVIVNGHSPIKSKIDKPDNDLSFQKNEAPSIQVTSFGGDSFNEMGYEFDSGSTPNTPTSKEAANAHLNVSQDERSRQLRARREKAEREMEEAKYKKHLTKDGSFDYNFSLDDDDDTYTSDVVPDSPRDILEKNRDLTSPLGSYVHGVLGSTSPLLQHTNNVSSAVNGDDGLSYTDTDNEDSLQLKLQTTTPQMQTPDMSMSHDASGIATPRTQDQIREQKRQFERERSLKMSLEQQKKGLERERTDLLRKVDDLSHTRSTLEQHRVELEAKLRSVDYQLNEEVEKRKSAETVLQKTKEQLQRKEEQYTVEVEEKQKLELSMRNYQMELRTAQSTIKQLEDEKEDILRQLTHEKSSRQLQEQINEDQIKLQQTIGLNSAPPTSSGPFSHEAPYEIQSEDTTKLKAELSALKLELDRTKTRLKDDHNLLTQENEELQSRIEDLKNEIKLNEEALAQASMQYNMQVGTLKADNTRLSSSLEKERLIREKLESEVDSLKARLQTANSEFEKSQNARTEIERNLQKDREEWNRLMEKKDAELSNVKELNMSLSQRVGVAETKLSTLESELGVRNVSLLEKTNMLGSLQKELDHRRSSIDSQEIILRKEKTELVKCQTKLEGLQEQLTLLQHENIALKQSLDAMQSDSSLKERSAIEVQERFAELLNQIRADYDKTRFALEEKNTKLLESLEKQRDDQRNSDMKRSHLELEMKNLQQEYNNTLQKLSKAEAAVELSSKAKDGIDHEKIMLRQEVEKLQGRLQTATEKQAEAQVKIAEMVDRVDRTERNAQLAAQQLASSTANVEQVSRNKGEKEDQIHQLEVKNARLESSLEHEVARADMLQRELRDSNRVRDSLEQLLTGLKDTNIQLSSKLGEETLNRTVMAQEADDHRDLWESEVKSKSKLGLRIAQLERAKQEATAIMEEEKRKARKAIELKKVAETKLEALQEKNTEYQKEIATLKTHLKAARKRLRELESSDSRINTLHSDFDRERMAMEGTLSSLRRQMDDVNHQLQNETDQKERLEAKNRQLQQELNSLRSLEKSYQKLEKSKRKVEEEFALHKAHVAANYVDRVDVDKLRNELETKSRLEVNQKLEEVNAFLEDQSQARERLDTIRTNNESKLRSEYESKQKDIQEELAKLRQSHHDLANKVEEKDTELYRMKMRVENEARLKEKLSNRLTKVNDIACDSQAQLNLERKMRSSPMSTMGIENGWLSSPVGSGKLSPTLANNNNDFTYKMRNELNRSIAKHLEAMPSDPPKTPRLADDSLLNLSYGKSSNDYLALLRRQYLLH
ncbi:uncharacterized protein LOC141902922 isoform X2 [Tubulanus polymorphus]|uniref:uncharacterized protein LOC141902922 isoform X2 n=1 Tax=Tubulanus polymorphus TaxID=672921 RepID=UPI003DA257A3